MSSSTSFSFGSQPLKNASGSSSSPDTSNTPQKPLFGGSVLSNTPVGAPPAFTGIFGQGGPVVTGPGAFGPPHSSSFSKPEIGSSATGSGLSGTNTVAGTNLLSNGPADNLPVSFTFNSASLKLQAFGTTQPNVGSASTFWSAPSTSNNTAAGKSATGGVSLTPALLSSNNTATSTGNLSGASSTTKPAFTFTVPQTTTESNSLSIIAATENIAPIAPPATSIFGSSGQSAFPPAQTQQTSAPPSAAPSSPSIFAPAQAQPNLSVIGGQLTQLTSTSAGHPVTDLFGVSASQAATGNTAQLLFPSATSGHPGGPTVFSPPAVTSIFSATTSAASTAPPVRPLFAPVKAQTSAPPTPVLAPTVPAPTSAAPPGTSLFESTAIPTSTGTSISTPTVVTAPHNPSAENPLLESLISAGSGVSRGSEAKTSLPQLPPENKLNHNRSLEEIVNRWSSDLETYKANFIRRGLEVKRLDAIIFENLLNTKSLITEVDEAEKKGNAINRTLDQLASDQEYLENLFDYYEASLGNIEKEHLAYQPVDEEREKVFQAVLTINNKLLELGTGLEDMIKELNDANAKVDNTTNTENPLFPIVGILNDHLSVMQWIDAQTASLAEKIKAVRMKSIVRPHDNEGDEVIRHYHNEY